MRELAKQIPAGSIPGRGGSSDKGCQVVPGGVQSPVWVEGSEEEEGSEGCHDQITRVWWANVRITEKWELGLVLSK